MDFKCPAKTIVGEVDKASGELVAALYAKLEAPLVRVNLETADGEVHRQRVARAQNRVRNLDRHAVQISRVDSKRAMEMFCMDTKLNIDRDGSPGFAFGGSCLPKISGP